jgi:hypothetical protein
MMPPDHPLVTPSLWMHFSSLYDGGRGMLYTRISEKEQLRVAAVMLRVERLIGSQTRSIMSAIPWPTPMHIVHRA